jgi:hypothetical protein
MALFRRALYGRSDMPVHEVGEMIPDTVPLLSFPIFSFVLFRLLDRREALIWSVLIGYLFIPGKAVIDLPVLPAIDENTMPVLCGLLFMWMTRPAGLREDPVALPGLLPTGLLFRALVFALIGGAFLTVATNTDPLRYGPLTLPGMRLYDGFSVVLSAIMLILPMLAARKYLHDEAGHRVILKALTFVGLIYAVPIAYELIMSPQLNRMIYGYFPHQWIQHVRPGGYRPIVFLDHGLVLAIIMCCCALAAFGLARISDPKQKTMRYGIAALLLLIVAGLNSLGGLVILVVLLPVVLLLKARKQLLICAVIAGAILVFPALRSAGLVPTYLATDLASRVHADRAASLGSRFFNEDMLLEKAAERPLFGWGIWGRARVYGDGGQDLATTDGLWVIQIGETGWVGYVGMFGLLCLPIVAFALRRRNPDINLTTSTLCVVLVANLIDLIPNTGMTPVTWVLAGALIGRLERRSSPTEQTETVSIRVEPHARSGYTRFPDGVKPRGRHQPPDRPTRRRQPLRTGRRADGA